VYTLSTISKGLAKMVEDNSISLPWITKEEAFLELQRIAREQTESVIILDHALDRQNQRDITHRQVLNTLRFGNLNEPGQWDTKEERGWKYKLTHITAGDRVCVIAKVVQRDGNKCLVITVWS
jgi:hypothetical protein